MGNGVQIKEQRHVKCDFWEIGKVKKRGRMRAVLGFNEETLQEKIESEMMEEEGMPKELIVWGVKDKSPRKSR